MTLDEDEKKTDTIPTANGSGDTAKSKRKGGGASNADLKGELDKERARAKELEGRLEAALKEQKVHSDALKELQQELAEVKEAHTQELSEFDERLHRVQEEKQQLDTQYRNLLDRLATIKTTLGDRLKADAVSPGAYSCVHVILSHGLLQR